jgi:hypothetical protein
MKKISLSIAIFALMTVTPASKVFAQSLDDNQGAVEVTDDSSPPPAKESPAPKVGRKAAAKYMGVSPQKSVTTPYTNPSHNRQPASLDKEAHYLALHVGSYVSDNAYHWGGADNQSDVGRLTIGLTYRIGEWVNSMDLAFRVDYSTYNLDMGKPSKLSFLPMITFPDASSRFPLYFGVAAGPGVFVTQINNKSELSLDYQLVLGARFFNIFPQTGFFIEAGLKNSLFLLSDGQFNGTFVSVGSVFSF